MSIANYLVTHSQLFCAPFGTTSGPIRHEKTGFPEGNPAKYFLENLKYCLILNGRLQWIRQIPIRLFTILQQFHRARLLLHVIRRTDEK